MTWMDPGSLLTQGSRVLTSRPLLTRWPSSKVSRGTSAGLVHEALLMRSALTVDSQECPETATVLGCLLWGGLGRRSLPDPSLHLHAGRRGPCCMQPTAGGRSCHSAARLCGYLFTSLFSTISSSVWPIQSFAVSILTVIMSRCSVSPLQHVLFRPDQGFSGIFCASFKPEFRTVVLNSC